MVAVAKRSRKHQKRSASRANRRAEALASLPAPAVAGDLDATRVHPAAAPDAAVPPVGAAPPLERSRVSVAPTVATPPADDRRRRRRGAWVLALAALIGAGVLAAVLLGDRADDLASGPSPRPSIEVGVPGGEVVNDPTPTPQPTASDAPEPTSTEAPPETPEPTLAPATPAPTHAPVAASTPVPATAAPAADTPAPATPAPRPSGVVAAAVASPADAVVAFYRRVTDGNFDAAYALWSDRMKATYPRQENLDERFDSTASIEFSQLYVAEQTATSATVQANFTETYDGGGSRDFVGYWRLIRTDRGWLLDAPNY